MLGDLDALDAWQKAGEKLDRFIRCAVAHVPELARNSRDGESSCSHPCTALADQPEQLRLRGGKPRLAGDAPMGAQAERRRWRLLLLRGALGVAVEEPNQKGRRPQPARVARGWRGQQAGVQ